LGRGSRIETVRSAIEESEHPLAAAIGDFEEHGAVATFDIFGLD